MPAIAIDFETTKIISGSPVAPTPVGVAIRAANGSASYLAWGHPTNNNSTLEEAQHRMRSIIKHVNESDDTVVIMHNVKFDLRIINEYFDLTIDKGKFVDTMIMAYLHDPREPSLKLKDLVLKYCNYPALNQAKLNEWITKNTSATAKTAGEYISLAPGDLAGEYAMDDVKMTYALFEYYVKKRFTELEHLL